MRLKIKKFLLTFIVSMSIMANETLPEIFLSLYKDLYTSAQVTRGEIKKANTLFSQNQHNFTFLETEALKYTLSYSHSLKKGYRLIDQKMFNQLKKKVESMDGKRRFTKYIYQRILLDLGELLTDPEYKTYKQLVEANSVVQSKLRKFAKRVALITPWIRLLFESESAILESNIDEFSYKLHIHITKMMELLNRTNTKEFTEIAYLKNLDDELNKAREEIKALSFIVSPEPDPDYKKPEKLPEPVDPWVPVDETIIEDGAPLTKDMLFPEPDPDYVPPKELPKPVKLWE